MADSGSGDLADRLRSRDIREVRVIFLDYNGIARARSLSVASLEGALRRGVNFSSPTVDFNSKDLFPPDAAFNLASPDFWARPDPASYLELPWEVEIGQMYADLIDEGGEPWKGCPRTALKRVAERAVGRDLRFNVGFEPEGYVLQESDEGVALAGLPQFATVDGLEVERPFTEELLQYLPALGLEVEQWSEEYGPGQIEINLRYREPLAAADGLTTFKQAFRSVARTHGLVGTFMPKPFADQAGTGLHVHLSASPLGGDDNVFDDPDDVLGLSQTARHALGGLLRHGEALTALGSTLVNSYKRFLPGSWAPTHVMYAHASRAAFIRIPERSTPRRLELRVADPACNPYMFLTGILAAMLDGIENEIEPGPPVPGDVGAIGVAEAAALGLRPLPRTLERALEDLAEDAVIREALGPTIIDEFIKVKRSEWDDFCRHVGEWDRDWYLRRY